MRRQGGLDVLACLALSALCFSQARIELLLRADWGFFNRVPLGASALVALVLNIGALAAVGVVGVQVMRRFRRPAALRLAAVAAVTALLVSLNFARITHETLARWSDAVGPPVLLVLVVLALAAALAWPRAGLRVVRGLALAASPLAVLTVAHASWMLLEVAGGPVWRRVDPAPLAGTAPSLRRVVWLVLDGLDQRLTFEARPADLELPALDRLWRESLYADAARPPAGTTELSMPALLTGRSVVAVVPTSPNDLELTFTDGKAARWSTHPSVFSRARALGYDTALIGWHLPYPRVLGGSLGVADWRPSVASEQARGETFGETLRNQWESLAPPVHGRRLLAERVAELGDLALRTAAESRFGLVLLHLPVPRAPAIYDRATGRLTPRNFTAGDGASLDNLVFADRLTAELRRRLERARLGDRTWLLVSASRGSRASPDDDRQADHRVPFLVRPPDGGRARHVDVPFNTLATHDLVLAILRGSINDARDAADWLARQTAALPRDYASDGRPLF